MTKETSHKKRAIGGYKDTIKERKDPIKGGPHGGKRVERKEKARKLRTGRSQ